MFLCYDIIRDVPRLRSLSLSLTISSKVNATKPAERTIRGFELTQMQRSARGEMMWRARMILPRESVSGSSSSLRR